MQAAYLLKGIRNSEDVSEIAHNCLMCGRCDTKCPVGIELTPIRMIRRRAARTEPVETTLWEKYFPGLPNVNPSKSDGTPSYSWLPEAEPQKADIIYFAGCMSHLTPSIKNSMIRILDACNVKYNFLDKDGGVCCGRPLMLSGQDKEARELINYNSQLIWKSGAQTLVTSCPICYKVFRESYYLDVEVLHHSQFIKRMIDEGSLKLSFLRKSVAYHAPCELGRRSGVYDEPKEVLKHVARLQTTEFEDSNSLCCGGSLGNLKISTRDKKKIASDAAAMLTTGNPEILATSCPLCKKTLAAATTTKVSDIAEIVAEAIIVQHPKIKLSETLKQQKEPANIN